MIEEIHKSGVVRTSTNLATGEKKILEQENLPEGAAFPLLAEAGGEELFIEEIYDLPHLVALGGGHVGVCVTKLAVDLGFRVTVSDDREEFIRADRFVPEVRRIPCASFDDADLWDAIPDSRNTFYVMASRSHVTDGINLRHVLRRRRSYAGMLGNAKKRASLTGMLIKEHGFSEEDFNDLHCPIGLPLGGRRPMEVALSIMAEVVKERYIHDLPFIDPEIMNFFEGVRPEGPLVMATILSTKGCTPRKPGSRMLITPSGEIFGSVGGGITEYAVTEEGQKMCAKGGPSIAVLDYGLSEDRKGEKGMICGGSIRIMLELL